MDIMEIIRSVVHEGCIEETLSALNARLPAHNAQDATFKAALSQMATDETRHAQFAWDTIHWIIERYPDTQILLRRLFVRSWNAACFQLEIMYIYHQLHFAQTLRRIHLYGSTASLSWGIEIKCVKPEYVMSLHPSTLLDSRMSA